jgi:trehalose-phosphatase
LREALEELPAQEHVLIGVDFDGTLAPLADEPMSVEPVRGSMSVMHQLAALEGITVALVSGRALGPLRQLIGPEGSIVLIGSHGAESSHRSELSLDDDDRARFDALADGVEGLLREHPRARVERKPAAVVLHTRGLSAEEAGAATRAARAVADDVPGVHLSTGKDVMEMSVTRADKGSALLELAGSVGATRILYAGDDVTDEDAYAQLSEPDVSVKVGSGDTAARFRVDDEEAVVVMLQQAFGLLST